MSKEEKKLNKKWDLHRTVQSAVNSSHPQSAPETRERLATLETNQNNIMEKLIEFQEVNKEQHKEITDNLNKFHEVNRQAFEDLTVKIDKVLAIKADKEEVKTLSVEVEDLKIWKIKLITYGSIILFMVTFLKEQIIHLISKI